MISPALHEWFVLRADEQHGPFSDDEMHAAATGGHFEPSDYVWRAGLDEWQPAGSVFTLAGGGAEANAAAIGEAAVVTPPPPAAEAPLPDAVPEASASDAAETAAVAAWDHPAEPSLGGGDTIPVAASPPTAEARIRPPPLPVGAWTMPPATAPLMPQLMQAPASAEATAPTHVAGGGTDSAMPADAAKGAPPQWPMPVSAFLSGPFLQRSDVVLTRKNRDFKSWLIRWATNGSFSHAALVFLVPHQERGFNNSFVIESASGGVDLTNFMDYVADRRSIVGIKRMTKPWFNEEVQARIRGRMLNTIKSTYSYATILRLVRELFSDVTFGVKSRIYGPTRAIQTRHDRQIAPPNKFICSGLVQMGFVQTLVDMAGEQRLPPEFLSDIVFREDLRQFLPNNWDEFSAEEQSEIMWEFATGFADLLEAATPEDLASSPQLEWVYVIKRGLVYPATSDDHVRELLTWKPKKRKV